VELDLGRALELVGWPLGGRTEQLSTNAHGDRHWRIDDPYGRAASLRVIRVDDTTEAVVRKRIEVGRAYTRSGVPFMRLLTGPVRHGDEIVVLHEWLAGTPVDQPTVAMAHQVGRLLKRLHEVGRTLSTDDESIICHGDVSMANVLWSDAETLTGLVGLTKIGVCDPARELARVVEQWELADAVLEGYGAISRPSPSASG
jgi:Ser/Thr protein kinase RdoA (MazF antagonist)